MLPVTLLTGFLGSGKTTVLNRLLKQLPLTAVVMNEFGEIGLDHQLLEETRGPLALLAGGCVCCQVQGALAPTLKNLWTARDRGELPAFERLIIETTGIADPAPILEVLNGDRWLAARFRLDGIVTTVDAVLGETSLNAHFEAQRQVAVADRLLLTKTDLAAAAALAALEARLTELNPAATQLRVLHGAVAPAEILGAALAQAEAQAAQRWLAAPRYLPAGPGAARHLAATGQPAPHASIHSFCLTFDEPLDWAGVEAALEMLFAFRARHILRMKAIVHLRGEPLPRVLHAVQQVFHPPLTLPAWPDADRRSRFVFIVHDLDAGFVAKLLRDFTAAAA